MFVSVVITDDVCFIFIISSRKKDNKVEIPLAQFLLEQEADYKVFYYLFIYFVRNFYLFFPLLVCYGVLQKISIKMVLLFKNTPCKIVLKFFYLVIVPG